MGYYVNPPGESKEKFLEREGIPCDGDFGLMADGATALVCLVDNVAFTAAGVVFSEGEHEAFADLTRRKKWFLVGKDKLYPVTPGLKPETFK